MLNGVLQTFGLLELQQAKKKPELRIFPDS
jgi:hypothetical protein